MPNFIELQYEDQDPETGKTEFKTCHVPHSDDSVYMSSVDDGEHQIYIYSKPESKEEGTLIDGLFFRFLDNGAEEIYHIPGGLELDHFNLVEIFGEERMSDLSIVSVSTE